MPFIAFLGCDGSGKSAVIQGMAEHLESLDIPVIRGHWRPAPFAASAADSSAADDPHGQQPRGFASSVLKLAWLWLNWWVAWFQSLRHASHDGVVLFDRYHGDLTVDPKRYRYGGPLWLSRLASRLMPQPDCVIFLDAPPEVLLARKMEVAKEALENARHAYLEFCRMHANCRIIDASQSLDTVISDAIAAATGRR
jgi:thymidylate kinase